MDELMLVFLEESKDNIENLSENLLLLENEPNNLQLINDLFRYAHTLKGMYATMGFNSFADLMHKMEDLMDDFRSKKQVVSSEKIDILLQCVSVLEAMTNQFESTGSVQINIDKYIELLSNSNAPLNKNESPIPLPLPEDASHLKVTVFIRDIEMKSVRLLMLVNALENFLEIISCSPSKEELLLLEDSNSIGETFIFYTDKNIDLKELEKVVFIAGEASDKNLIKSVEIGSEEHELRVSDIEDVVYKKPSSETSSDKNITQLSTKVNQIVRIESEKIDNLMNLVAEMVTEKNRLGLIGTKLDDPMLSESISRIDRLINNIQDIIMKVRMVEMENTFKIFPREIRNISNKLGKKVNLIIEGEKTELDRAVVDQIKNPLVHIIKNSLDHGIESPQQRIATGKDEYASLRISASYEGNQVLISVSDDGKGVDPDVVVKKAIEKNLITKEKAVTLSRQDKINLICMPGFSTSTEVTELSGRGVGLDAVRGFIEGLNGSFSIDSVKGEGTIVKLYVPLSLAIIQSMLISVNNETFAVPLHSIENIISINDVAIRHLNESPVIIYKKNTIPLIHLSDIVKSSLATEKEEFIILVRKNNKLYGLAVHEIIGQQEIVIKSLGEHLKNSKQYSGATILDDGSVALILDTTNIF